MAVFPRGCFFNFAMLLPPRERRQDSMDCS